MAINKGPLVKVQIGKGQYVKMYEADAKAAGLDYLPDKRAVPAGNKLAVPEANKEVAEEEGDDLTTIPGVGPATLRLLNAKGIKTFQQLYAAGDLGYLGTVAQKGIVEWRETYVED